MRRKYGPLMVLPVNNSASNFAGAALCPLKDLFQAYLQNAVSEMATSPQGQHRDSLRYVPLLAHGCCALV